MALMLIVEDDEFIVELIKVAFEGRFEFSVAMDGLTALNKLKRERPALVFCDVSVHGLIDGLSVCRSIKNDQRTAHIPVALISGWGTEDDIQRGLAAGADKYFVKPFSMKQLEDWVKELSLG